VGEGGGGGGGGGGGRGFQEVNLNFVIFVNFTANKPL